MKAITHTSYGSPLDLDFKEVEEPVPKADEVKIKIKTASVNATDFEIIRGDFIVRVGNGFRSPKNWRLGCDFAGIVESVGEEVVDFKPGDEVYADLMYQNPSYGTFAEYVSVPEGRLRLKPDHLSFEEAATIPQAGTLAVQGIREHMNTEITNKVLINGAGGGVGTYALQIAKYFGGEVTVVDHSSKFDMLADLGADHFIDYREEDFTKSGNKYHLILDVIAKRGVFAHRRVLRDKGEYRLVGGSLGTIVRNGIFGGILSKISSKKVGILFGRPNDKEDMEFLADLIKNKHVKPVIDEIFPLSQTPKAIKYLQDGKAKGKLVIQI